MSTITEQLAEEIRVARVRANLTQVELAEQIGVSPRSVQDWEAAKSLPRARHRRKLAEFLERAA